MGKVEELEKEITKLTDKVREKNPAIYEHLTENPITLPERDSDGFLEALKKYKVHLEELLKQ